MNELDSLRQEAEALKNAIRVSQDFNVYVYKADFGSGVCADFKFNYVTLPTGREEIRL